MNTVSYCSGAQRSALTRGAQDFIAAVNRATSTVLGTGADAGAGASLSGKVEIVSLRLTTCPVSV